MAVNVEGNVHLIWLDMTCPFSHVTTAVQPIPTAIICLRPWAWIFHGALVPCQYTNYHNIACILWSSRIKNSWTLRVNLDIATGHVAETLAAGKVIELKRFNHHTTNYCHYDDEYFMRVFSAEKIGQLKSDHIEWLEIQRTLRWGWDVNS